MARKRKYIFKSPREFYRVVPMRYENKRIPIRYEEDYGEYIEDFDEEYEYNPESKQTRAITKTITKLFLLNTAMIFVVYSIFPDLQGSMTLLKINPQKKNVVMGLWAFAIGFTVLISYCMAKEGKLVKV